MRMEYELSAPFYSKEDCVDDDHYDRPFEFTYQFVYHSELKENSVPEQNGKPNHGEKH